MVEEISYFTDRSQFIMYNGTKSSVKLVRCGVPQGFVLGPLFFVAYMNDILNAFQLPYIFMLMLPAFTCL